MLLDVYLYRRRDLYKKVYFFILLVIAASSCLYLPVESNGKRMTYFFSSLLISCLLLVNQIPLGAQPNQQATHTFEDGVYKSHEDMKANKPTFRLYELPNFGYQLDREDNLLFLSQETVNQLAGSKVESLDKIWGLCIKGVPYMKVHPSGKDGVVYFVRYHILGRICYLYYPSIEDRAVEMPIYNPYSGERVGGRTVTNKERRLVKQLMLFETGELRPYSVGNFKDWAQDDERLMRTFERLSEEEAQEKLFKSIKIYNERHPIF